MTVARSPGSAAGERYNAPAGSGPRSGGVLATEVTTMVGRKTEITEVCRALTGARLVTVIGPGGVGKTRVALEAARRLNGSYPDGVRLAELSGLADPDLLPDTVAASLGLARQETRSPFEAILHYLSGRRTLLVLDTCEHLIEACALFAERVLRAVPDVDILATSRQALDTTGEHTYQLAPLPVPGGAFVPGPGPGALDGAGDAAELFTRRAAEASPAFTANAESWDDLVRICRRLDGIPLAIELAAVRLRVLPLGELAARLEQRFDTLGSRRAGPPRHRTLQTAIEWSYDLCTEPERQLWARLSVFAGGFDLRAAEEVCAGHGLAEADILATLFGLVEKSVVLREGDRYRVLDTLREFGAERLAESGRERVYRGRHVGRYLRIARDFAEHFLDHDQLPRLWELRAEHDNLRAAMRYALDSGNERLVRDGAALAAALAGYWRIGGLLREGRYWLGRALDRLPAGPGAERALALIVSGYLGTWAGITADAVDEIESGAVMARALADDRLLARARVYQNVALMFNGQLDEALAIGAEAQQRAEAVGDRIGLLILHTQMGHLHEVRGDLPAAVESSRRTLRGLEEDSTNPETGEVGESWLQSLCCMVMGLALHLMGRTDQALASFTRGLPLAYARGDSVTCGYGLEGFAISAAAGHHWTRVAWLVGAEDALWDQVGSRMGGNPYLMALHERTAGLARDALGAERFDALYAQGAGHPLGAVVEQALGGADALEGPDEPADKPAGNLTAREREIAGLVATGLSNRDVAEQLVISVRTVDSHVEHIYTKLGISSRVELALWVRQH